MLRLKSIVALMLGLSSVANAELGSPEFTFSADCHRAEATATLSFTGDILVHDGLYQHTMRGERNFSRLWHKTNSLINKADYSVANLEGPAAMGIDVKGRDHGDVGFTYDLNIYSGTNFSFNFHPRILRDLKDSGYDLLTMANNHALDRRAIGIDKTLETAASVGITTVGTRASYDRGGEFYKVANIRGVNVAFISCTEMTNGASDKKEQVLYCYKNGEKIINMISVLSRHQSIDAVVVLPHWGQEYQPLPDKSQRSYAKKFLDAGATAIIGSHPHVLQPWEKYVTGDGRETVIMYSLGNFLAFQAGLEKKTGVVAYIGLAKEGGKTSVSGVGFTPTYRDAYEVKPVDNMPSDMARLIAKNFGKSNRITSDDNLSVLCQ